MAGRYPAVQCRLDIDPSDAAAERPGGVRVVDPRLWFLTRGALSSGLSLGGEGRGWKPADCDGSKRSPYQSVTVVFILTVQSAIAVKMREIDDSVPVKTETRNALRAQKTGGQTYDNVVRVMAALYIEARRQAESEMSGHERIQARANDVSPVEYVHDLDVDSIIATATRTADNGADDATNSGVENDVADAALGGRERVEADASELSPEDYIWQEFGLDASEYDDPADLRDDIHAQAREQAQADGGVTERKKPDDFDQPVTAQQAQQSDADALAAKALSGQDRVAVQASDHPPADYVRQEYGVDPADYADPGDLRTAMEGE